jgi:type I restriction-modification system DNA methylase subunit
VTDGKITYTLYKPTLSETYAGYGTNTKTTNMDDLYIEYVKAYANKESAKNDPTLSKKDQKSIIKAADEFIKDKEESLMEAETALRDLIKMMESNLFR